jgi:hypothetical protein
VLFDLLTGKESSLSSIGAAEQRVLWEIEAQLERVLVEPLDPNYSTLVEIARKHVLAEV